MKIPFKNLMIDLDIEGLIEIEFLELTEKLNCHAKVEIGCYIEDSFAEKAVLTSDPGLTVILYDGDSIVFYGFLSAICSYKERGGIFLKIEFASKTQDMDQLKHGRVFYKQQDSYYNVINKVLKPYPNIQMKDEITNGKQMPGVLVQYEETDWEFLIRIASHFSSFIVSDSTSQNARFYFGIPEFHNDVIFIDSDYEIIQDSNQFGQDSEILKQEYIHWRIVTEKVLRMGEVVTFNGIDAIVMEIHFYSKDGELIREYTLHRKEGLLSHYKINYELLGLSLPATVINRKQNQVQVKFDINTPYESEQPSKYFVYAIESSSFYCMPEVDSRLHIYFPGKYEAEAMAVHALNADGGSVPVPKPSNKSFSSPTGASMQLTPSSYTFKSDTSGSSVLRLGVDGNICITGTNVLLNAKKSIVIGKGEKDNTPEIMFTAETEQSIKVNEGSSSIDINSNTQILADQVHLKAESGDMSADAAVIKEELENTDSQTLPENGGDGNQPESHSPGGGTLPYDNLFPSSLILPGELPYVPAKQKKEEPEHVTFETDIDGKFNVWEKEKSPDNQELSPPRYPGVTSDDHKKQLDNAHPGVSKNLSISGEARASAAPIDVDESRMDVKGGVFNAYANGDAYAGIMAIEDGKPVFRPGAGVSAGVGVSVGEVELKGYATDKNNQIFNGYLGGNVKVLRIGAEADIGFGYVDKKWKVGAEGEAGVYILEGGLSGGVTVAGVDVGVGVEGKVGVGAEFKAGFIDNKLKFKVGATLLIGGSVELEIDFSDVIEGCDQFGDMVSGWFD